MLIEPIIVEFTLLFRADFWRQNTSLVISLFWNKTSHILVLQCDRKCKRSKWICRMQAVGFAFKRKKPKSWYSSYNLEVRGSTNERKEQGRKRREGGERESPGTRLYRSWHVVDVYRKQYRPYSRPLGAPYFTSAPFPPETPDTHAIKLK